MAFDAQFIDGFDKYGEVGDYLFATASLTDDTTYGLPAMRGEWTGAFFDSSGGAGNEVCTIKLAEPMGGTGKSLQMMVDPTNTNNSRAFYLFKTLPANYARMIGGRRVQVDLVTSTVHSGWHFYDGAVTTPQMGIRISSSGALQVYRGSALSGGTLLGSGGALADGSRPYIEWDITFHNSAGIVKIWVDGVLTVNLTSQDNCATANNYFNGHAEFIWSQSSEVPIYHVIDHAYNWYFLAGGSGDTPLLNSPVVETQNPIADSVSGWAADLAVFGAWGYAVGNTGNTSTAVSAGTANQLAVRRFVARGDCTINSISFRPRSTSAGAKFKVAIYADAAGVCGALMSGSSESVGCTSDVVKTIDLTTPQALVEGTAYWIGTHTDTAINFIQSDDRLEGYIGTFTYSSGLPSAGSGLTANAGSRSFWGNCDGFASDNYQVVDANPHGNDYGYLVADTVGEEELYDFPPLIGTPTTITTVAVKAALTKLDGGAATVDLEMKSGVTTGNGSNPGVSPGATADYHASYFNVDPNTAAAWTYANLNAAESGVKKVS